MAIDGDAARIEWVGEPPDPDLLGRWIEAHSPINEDELDEWRRRDDD